MPHPLRSGSVIVELFDCPHTFVGLADNGRAQLVMIAQRGANRERFASSMSG
jgi:hypothetical protein